MSEVKQNYETLGGSMLHRLIHRAFPNWFKFNSVYVMQPMYLPSMNVEIFKQLGTLDQYCLDPPAPPPKMTILNKHASISALLNDQANFKVKYGMKLSDLVFPDFMFMGDGPTHRANHAFVAERVMSPGMGTYAKSTEETMRKILARESYKLGEPFQVDITKESSLPFHYSCVVVLTSSPSSIARVVTTLVHADAFNLAVSENGNEEDTLSEREMHDCMATWIYFAIIDADIAESFNLRREAHVAFAKLKKSTESAVRKNGRVGGLIGNFFAAPNAPKDSLKAAGQKLTQDILGAGYSIESTATTLFTTAAGGIFSIPNTVSRFILSAASMRARR